MTARRRLLAADLAVLAAPVATASADVPTGATWTEAYITTPGQPTLHVDVFRPKGIAADVKTPVILSSGPYFGHGGQSLPNGNSNDYPSNRFDDMIDGGKVFERGYSVVYADLRGFGASAGCNDFGGPGEQLDVKRAIEWAADQPWSTGKVGLWGKSYDGWTQVMALDEKPRGLAATVIQSPIIDGYRTLYQNGVHYDQGWYGTPALYQAIDAIPPVPQDSLEYKLGVAQGTNPACYAQNIALQTATLDGDDPYWKARELPGARGSDVPTFWSHGFMDANTKPDNFLPVWNTLTGPKRAWFGQYAHTRGNEVNVVGRDGFLDESMRWLDKYVKGENPDMSKDPGVTIQEGDGTWRAEQAWPPADAVDRTMTLKGGKVTDAPNNSAAEGTLRTTAGNGIFSFTPVFAKDARLAGAPRVSIKATAPTGARGHVVALLYDLDEENQATLVTRAASVVQGTKDLSFEMYPQDWTVRTGHRLGLLLAGADEDWYTVPHSMQDIVIAPGGTVELPFLTNARTAFLEGDEGQAIGGRRSVNFSAKNPGANETPFEVPPAMRKARARR